MGPEEALGQILYGVNSVSLHQLASVSDSGLCLILFKNMT